MEYNFTFTQNRSALVKCEKIYKWIFIMYASVCAPYILASFILIILTVSGDALWLFADGIIFKLLIFIFGLLGCYKKESLFTWLAPAASALNIAVCGSDSPYFQSFFIMLDDINAIILALSVIAAVITTLTNAKYHYLEQCEGFPYFNERFEESENLRNSGRDIYQEKYEEIKNKHKSDKMDDI